MREITLSPCPFLRDAAFFPRLCMLNLSTFCLPVSWVGAVIFVTLETLLFFLTKCSRLTVV